MAVVREARADADLPPRVSGRISCGIAPETRMTPARKEAILTAARGLGAEDFNRLLESVGQTRIAKRLRYWQEELLAKLPGVAPVSFAEFVAAFDGATRI